VKIQEGKKKRLSISLAPLTSVFFAVVLCATLWCSLCDAKTEIKVGVLAKRGPVVAYSRWNGLAEYLTKKTGVKHVVVPLDFSQLPLFVAENKVDLVIANQLLYVVLSKKYGIKALATISGKKAGPYMGGVIFCRKEKPISRLSDLRNKKIAAVSKRSAGGYLVQAHLLYRNGLNVESDLDVKSLKNQDYVVYGVLNKVFDAGFVRTDQLETMEKEGKIKISQFKIIHKMDHQEFPYLCSTELWPAWPIAASKTLSQRIKERIKNALLQLTPGSKAAKQAKISGFVAAGDYGLVRQAVKDLKISF